MKVGTMPGEPIPVQNLQAEAGLVWSMLCAPRVFQEYQERISPEMFSRREYELICRAFLEIAETGREPDAVNISRWLENAGLLGEIGGDEFLIECTQAESHNGHIESYVVTLIDKWNRREAIRKAGDIIEAATMPGGDFEEAAKQLLPSREWPEIESLDEPNLPPFPTEALPSVLRRWVEAESYATQTPADLAAMLSLAVCAAAIARRVEVEPRPGWREPVNIFTVALLEPGNRKSGVFSDTIRPLREKEAELIELATPDVAREQSERRQAESRLKQLEKLAAEKGDAEARHEAGELAEELAAKPESVLPRLLVDDATSEKLGTMLSEQGGRIASMSPEGGVFDLMAGMYSKSGTAQFGVYLQGHAGDDLVTDRISRKSLRVQRPALTCAYACQPAVMKGLAENPAFRGRGLLARFLYAYPRSWIGSREIATEPVSDSIRNGYYRAVQGLFELEGNCILNLSPEATDALRDWETEIEAMLNDGGVMESIRDWGAKLAGATLRLAAILHCVERGPSGAIGQNTVSAAIEISRYLIPHAAAVLSMMQANESPRDDDARYILEWIRRHEKREFTKSEAQHSGKRRFPRSGDIDPAMKELVGRGYLRQRIGTPSGPGRPPSPLFRVNPAVFENTEMRSFYSQNSTGGPRNSNCGNIGSAFEGFENQEASNPTTGSPLEEFTFDPSEWADPFREGATNGNF